MRNSTHYNLKLQEGPDDIDIRGLGDNFEQLDGIAHSIQTELDAHIANKNNPHGLTKKQLELENVKNVEQASKAEFDKLSQQVESDEKYTIYYGNCGSYANAHEKIVTCSDFPTELTAGLRIQVTFPYGNTVSSIKLNINGSSVPVYFPVGQSLSYDNSLIGKGVIPGRGTAEFVYAQVNSSAYAWIYKGASIVPPDGSITAAKLADDVKNRIAENEKFKIYYGVCDSVHGNSDKHVTCSEFGASDLVEGVRIEVVFNHGNTSNYMTLNVNNTGAKYTYFPIGGSREYNSPEIAKCIVGGVPYEFVYMSGTPDGSGGWVYCGATNIPADGSVTAERLADDVKQTLNGKAPLASPAFIGVPKAPTAGTSVNNTQIATTAFVKNAIADSCGDVTMNGLFDVISASGTAGFYHASAKAPRLLSAVMTTLGEAQFGKAYGSYSTVVGQKISLRITLRLESGVIWWDEYYNSSEGDIYIGTGTVTAASAGDSSVTFNYNAAGKSISIHNAVVALAENQYKLFDLMSDHISSTLVIAASNSKWKNKKNVNYVCSGYHDEDIISSAIEALPYFGGKIILLEGTYYISEKIICNKNVVFEGMGNGTVMNCTSHAFLHSSEAGCKITVRDMSFNLTGELDAENYFIQCAGSDMLIDNCKISAVTNSVSAYSADYITTSGKLTISHSDITVDLRYQMDCIAFVSPSDLNNNVLIDDCKIKVYYCVNGGTSKGFTGGGRNLYFMRSYGTIRNCNILCSGTANNLCHVVRSDVNILNCHICLDNSYTSLCSGDVQLNDANTNVLIGNYVYCYGSYINFLICGGNIIRKGSADKLMFRGGRIISGNRFINYARNDIEAEASGGIIFTNNILKYSCTVNGSGTAVITNNI